MVAEPGVALPAGVTRTKSPEVQVREFSLPGGILCPLLKREYIVQQANCTTCNVMGLAKAIRKNRPWACPSKDRIPDNIGYTNKRSNWCTEDTRGVPGTIVVKEGRDGKPGVVNMMAQFSPGRPNHYGSEDSTQRELWFK